MSAVVRRSMPRRPLPCLILGFASTVLSGAEFPTPFDTEKLQEGFTRAETVAAGFTLPPAFVSGAPMLPSCALLPA